MMGMKALQVKRFLDHSLMEGPGANVDIDIRDG